MKPCASHSAHKSTQPRPVLFNRSTAPGLVNYMLQTLLIKLRMATCMDKQPRALHVKHHRLQEPHSGAFAFFNLTLRPTLGFPALPSGFFSATLCCATLSFRCAALSFPCAPADPSAVPLAC